MLKKILLTVFVMGLVLPLHLRASTQDELVKFVNGEITKTADQLNGPVTGEERSSGWDMSRMFIRISGIFGIQVPVFAKFQIVPEVEFCVQKVQR